MFTLATLYSTMKKKNAKLVLNHPCLFIKRDKNMRKISACEVVPVLLIWYGKKWWHRYFTTHVPTYRWKNWNMHFTPLLIFLQIKMYFISPIILTNEKKNLILCISTWQVLSFYFIFFRITHVCFRNWFMLTFPGYRWNG